MSRTANFLLILIFSASTAFGQAVTIMGLPVAQTSTATATTNAAANWVLMTWHQRAAKTLSTVRMYMASETGTVAVGDLRMDIYATAAGVPTGASLANATSTIAGASNTWQEWTFSLSLSADTQYAFVVQNLNGTPASNFVTFRYLTGTNNVFPSGRILQGGVATSTSSGPPWTTTANAVPIIRLGYSDSTYAGNAIETVTAAPNANYRIYGTRSWGFQFTVPSNVAPNVHACMFSSLSRSGSPTGIRCRIYSVNTGAGTATVVATSGDVSATAYSTSTAGNAALYFSTPYSLTPGGNYLVALETTNTSDNSSNYTQGSTAAVENVAASLGLLPFAGSMRGAYCTGTCTTWSNWTVVADIPGAGLILNPAGEFASLGGGSTGCSYSFVK
jgi:hypothetical protein